VNGLEGLQPVHAWEAHIQNHQIRDLGVKDFEASFSGRSAFYRIAFFGEQTLEAFPQVVVIVNDQNGVHALTPIDLLLLYPFSFLKWMVEATGVSLKTEQRRSHSAMSSFRPWVKRAEGFRGTRHVMPIWQVPVKPWSPSAPPEAGKLAARLRCPLSAEYFSITLRFLFLETPPWPFPTTISKS
jgi:hypothetical protein